MMMRRLLWKEWVETRLFLLGLLAAPVFSMLVLKDQCGFVTRRDQVYSGPGGGSWIALLVIAVWAASRFPEEMRRSHFSVFWLPARGAKVFAAKFLPGLLALALAAPWSALMFWLIAPSRFGEPVKPWLLYFPALNSLASLLIAYCIAFNVSLYSNMVTGALTGFIGLLSMTAYSMSSLQDYWRVLVVSVFARGHFDGLARAKSEELFFYADLLLQFLFAVLMVLGSMIAFRKCRVQSSRVRVSWGLGSTMVLCVITAVAVYAAHPVPLRQYYFATSVYLLPSPNGQHVALIGSISADRLHSDNQSKVMPQSQSLQLVLSDLRTGRRRTVLTHGYIDLVTWSPDSKSVFVETGSDAKDPTHILRIDDDGRITRVASLPPQDTKDQWRLPTPYGRVTPDGRYLVVCRMPRWVHGRDIWCIDLQTNRTRVIAANVPPSRHINWSLLSNEALMLESGGGFREIPLDGNKSRHEWW